MQYISNFVRGDNFWFKYFIIVFSAYYVKYLIGFIMGGIVSSAGYYQWEQMDA
jgi:hypothetical protein